ncbi:hypothetical protein Saso_55500 [Streptomyces asoensis]|uniref:Uncharacterized protein n=1 Tax=Streptomyces asoensis TaxID=249586 RepID=A0ABQ3S7B2_9ACTN|nr:hypothetical protein Saso_55500 [Streptomyces asoensis]
MSQHSPILSRSRRTSAAPTTRKKTNPENRSSTGRLPRTVPAGEGTGARSDTANPLDGDPFEQGARVYRPAVGTV